MSVPNVGTSSAAYPWPQQNQDVSSAASETQSGSVQGAQDSYQKAVAALQSGQATYGPPQAGKVHGHGGHHHHHGGGSPAASTTASSTDDSTNPLSALGITDASATVSG
jgi:hypothetical protein